MTNLELELGPAEKDATTAPDTARRGARKTPPQTTGNYPEMRPRIEAVAKSL